MGTHPIFESDFDCLTDCRIFEKKMNRVVLTSGTRQVLLNRPVQALARPVLVTQTRNYISLLPNWEDNTPVAPHQWGTKFVRFMTRLPEIGWLWGFFAIIIVKSFLMYTEQQLNPELTFKNDPYLDNPMICMDKKLKHSQLEKVEDIMYANKNLYHQVYRPEDKVEEGKPWTDPRADLYLKRFWSIGNQKMVLENKVDRYMVHSPKGDVRLGIGFLDKYTAGWYSQSTGRKFNPSYDYTPPSQ